MKGEEGNDECPALSRRDRAFLSATGDVRPVAGLALATAVQTEQGGLGSNGNVMSGSGSWMLRAGWSSRLAIRRCGKSAWRRLIGKLTRYRARRTGLSDQERLSVLTFRTVS